MALRTAFAIPLLALLLPAGAHAQSRDLATVARQIVETAGVAPGDAVGIAGGQHTLPLMEAIAIEAAMRGGQTVMLLDTDRVQRAIWHDVPIEHLAHRSPFADILTALDVYIGLPGVDDVTLFDGVAEERFAAANAANADLSATLNSSTLRGVFVGYPTRAEAERAGVDFATYERMHWDALAADYGAISRTAEALARRVAAADRVRVTTPAGTDVTFSVAGRHVFRMDGRVTDEERRSGQIYDRTITLPGGELLVSIVESSASGRVVVPRQQCQGEEVRGMRFRFERGVLGNLEGDNPCLSDVLATHGDDVHRIAFMTIGLNPARTIVGDGSAQYFPADAAGMVWLNIGNNSWYAGENDVQGSFGVPLASATVELDGVAIVRDGRLVSGL